MANVVILQRVVPNYRVPVFDRVHAELGWPVVHSSNEPAGTFLDLSAKAEWSRPYPYRYLRRDRPTWCLVPVGQILRDLKPDAVLAEAALGMSSTTLLLARRRVGLGPRVFFWTHGFNADIGIASPRQRRRQGPSLAIFAAADGCLLYGPGGRDFVRRNLPGKPTFLASNTLDMEAIRQAAAGIAAHPAPGRPHLLAVGRFTEEKRFPALVTIFTRFRERFPGAALTLIGAGPDGPAIERTAGDLLGQAVFLPGQIYQEAALAPYFRSADAYVFTGAAGLSVNHALAYDLPVIVYAATGDGPMHRPEADYVIDGVTGRVVPDYSDAAMVEALAAFFAEHPSPRDSFGPHIRRFVDETLTLDRMVQGFRDLNAYLEGKGGG